jgi:TonB family protein
MGRWICLAALQVAFLVGALAAETKTDQKPAPLEVEMGPPQILSWVPPVFPREAIDLKIDGRVKVRFIVDETGAVAKARVLLSTHKVFEEAAVQSVRQWKFAPTVLDGRNVSKCVDVTVPFRRADLKRNQAPSVPPAEVILSLVESPYASPTKASGNDADYPDSLLPRFLPGVVVVKFSVSPEGRVQALQILGATHADFVQPALAAAEKWTFHPAQRGDLAVAAPMVASLEFSVVKAENKPVNVLEANGVTLANAPTGAVDTPPRLKILVDPVYPYDLLLAGTEGDAMADFVIRSDGRAESITVRETEQPAFGQALAAALDGWLFEPALRSDGTPVASKASQRWHFSVAPDSAVFHATMRLLQRMRANDTADMGARGLDGRLNPRYQLEPSYPSRLFQEKPSGEATIQFIVDRTGRSRLARIVSATREEFGWAAATAVEQWVFDPPRRGGQPTDVRVSIPFKFSPPK